MNLMKGALVFACCAVDAVSSGSAVSGKGAQFLPKNVGIQHLQRFRVLVGVVPILLRLVLAQWRRPFTFQRPRSAIRSLAIASRMPLERSASSTARAKTIAPTISARVAMAFLRFSAVEPPGMILEKSSR